ncbi:hypothetical protein M427DRAFT_359264 [Gonapodya prolifera JEL478]|uniref:C2 domain-containing protein n=1 Tax=Gonapodya prolifera (strain JEL478) TaxID=1344416 RepID=A0A139AB38_GONPJ|nr:hypothetical protein M427DRAFT_359264 [Gonapodya prolifera JEL478]|eukprot:KXS13884.1 hypothetical protein M427DRAFT_359264 [Gonapodya prolifera JEL478]
MRLNPFVVISFGDSTFRTRSIRHSTEPVWGEVMVVHVRQSNVGYGVMFGLWDWDRIGNNRSVGKASLKCSELIEALTKENTNPQRVNSNDLVSIHQPTPIRPDEKGSSSPLARLRTPSASTRRSSPADSVKGKRNDEGLVQPVTVEMELGLEVTAKVEESFDPKLVLRTSYTPIKDLRRNFWVALSRLYDTDDNGSFNRVEVQALLDAVGSNLPDAIVDGFWTDNGKSSDTHDLTFDELFEALETKMVGTKQLSVRLVHPRRESRLPPPRRWQRTKMKKSCMWSHCRIAPFVGNLSCERTHLTSTP